MKGLLIKDFKLLKMRGAFLLLIIVGYTAIQLADGNSGTGIGFATLMVGVFSLTTITYDEYENGMPFLLTLPIQRKDYVREKYLFTLLATIITWLFMSVVCFGFDVLVRKETGENLLDKLVFAVTYLIVICVTLSLQIALRIRFSERSAIVTVGIFAIMGAYVGVFFIGYSELDLNMEQFILAAAVVMLALIFVFYKWAVRTMEKREF